MESLKNMNIRFAPNTLYYGDCLDILRDFPSECVDLICLDPPFNSNANYHTIFRGSGLSIKPQIKAFDDMWLWDSDSEQRVREIKNAIANPASKVIAAFEMIMPQTPMLSYTSYMAQRLFEMYRVLKDTGSIYLHCDPTASHYLKLVMDAVFGEHQFQNEYIWYYSGGGASKKRWARKHDVLLFYAKGKIWTFNVDAVRTPHKWDNGQSRADGSERDYQRGKIPDDVFQHHSVMPWGKENLGYPTQKPLVLKEDRSRSKRSKK